MFFGCLLWLGLGGAERGEENSKFFFLFFFFKKKRKKLKQGLM